MKIGLQTWGSDGDIRPFLALAGGLSTAGHEVSLVITSVDNKDYSRFGQEMNFSVSHVGRLDYKEDFLNNFAVKLRGARVPIKQLHLIFKYFFDPLIPEMYGAAQELCAVTDMVIGHFAHHPVQAAAEKARKPYVTVTLNHSGIPSRYTVPLGVPNLGIWMNPFWWKLVFVVVDGVLKAGINNLRKQEQLPPVANVLQEVWTSRNLNLIAVSSAICQPRSDWNLVHKVCGFFNVPQAAEKWTMAEDLKDFLRAGPPPVYLTVGSMLSLDTAPEIITTILVEGARKAGCRALIQSRWDELPEFPDYPEIYKIKATPHQHIFPHCAVVVHHGGAGTTQSATRHGCPSIIIEHFGDQIFWAKELQRLGIAAKVLHRRNITAEKLAHTIRTVLDSPGMKEKTEKLGEIIRHEDGVKKAVGFIDQCCAQG